MSIAFKAEAVLGYSVTVKKLTRSVQKFCSDTGKSLGLHDVYDGFSIFYDGVEIVGCRGADQFFDPYSGLELKGVKLDIFMPSTPDGHVGERCIVGFQVAGTGDLNYNSPLEIIAPGDEQVDELQKLMNIFNDDEPSLYLLGHSG